MRKQVVNILRSLFSMQAYLFILSVASFILTVRFALVGDLSPFYGMAFIFILITLLLSPNVIDYLKMPGFEIKRYIQEARDLSNEIKEFARAIAFLSVRLAFRSTGWLTFGKETAELQDSIVEDAQRMLALIGSDLNSEQKISDYYYYHTLQEYKLYIVQHTKKLKSTSNQVGNKYERINQHRYYPNAATTPTGEEIKTALMECGEYDDEVAKYIKS